MNHNKTKTKFSIGDRVLRTDGFSPVGIIRNKIISRDQVSYNVEFPTITYQENIKESCLRQVGKQASFAREEGPPVPGYEKARKLMAWEEGGEG